MSDKANTGIGVVVIGRNEGERLRACLKSVVGRVTHVVYVDSGSTDQSVAMAESLSVHVVQLDMTRPFTAARARNAGFARLREVYPGGRYVQFIDGDCEIFHAWLDKAASFLDQHQEVAIVCGRLRERFPQHSIYNMLCDIEWDTPVGEVQACGGIAMARAEAFGAVNGFLETLIAGEEPELCVRLRRTGWKIWRMDEEMAWHDASMTTLRQWWKRTVRGGYAFAEGAYLHGAAPERHWVRQSRSAWFWGGGIPLAMIAAVVGWGWLGVVVLAAYPLQIVRLAMRGRRTLKENCWSAFFIVFGKFPELLGQIKFIIQRLRGQQGGLIEYK